MANVLHSHAKGIHPGAFVQASAPDTSAVQDGVLWLDTSAGPPYVLKRWDATGAAWRAVQMDGTGYPLPGGHRLERYARSGGQSAAATPPGVVVLSAVSAEQVIPGLDVTLSDFDGALVVSGGFVLHDQVPQDAPYDLVARLRREGLDGAALLTTTWTAPDSQTNTTGVGLVNNYQWLPEVVDSAPTTGRYVLTVQKLAQAGIALTAEFRGLHVRELNEAGERLRVVHAASGPVLDLPFEYASGPAATFLGRDAATGLPRWSGMPLAQVTAAPLRPPSTTVDTCVQVRCGVAQACVGHLTSLYADWANVINAGLAILGGTVTALALAVLLDPATAALGAVVWSFLKADLEGLAVAAFASGCGVITADLTTTLTNALFCALSCTGDVCTVDAAALEAWSARLTAQGWPGFDQLQAVVLNALIRYTAAAEFQAMAATASPSSACDGWTCA